MAASSSDEVNIKVAIRIRPTNEREKARSAKQIVTCDHGKKQVNLTYGTGKKAVSKSFHFDNVFGQYSTQAEVFTAMVAPVVDEVMEGYNCTVFAYGQTGTGKTHTMEGQFDDAEQRGIIPRSVHLIFQQLEEKKVDFSVKVSYLEIYNEELGDLLDDSYSEASSDKRKSLAPSAKHKKLLLCDGEKGVVCNNLTEVNCCSAKEVFESLRKGINARQVAETQMNKASSRSHSIVTLKIMIKEATVNGEQVRFGQLNLVDLAGSECVQRSGATGERLREAGNINQSLLTLGRVITGLSEKKSGFIPYRDSKLTRLLQESLGGRAKTCIVATLSPADDSADESGSTLEYAHRARSIKNKPVTNSTSSKNSVLREYTQEVEEMRKILQAQREKSGTYLPTEKYEEMLQALETGKANLGLCEEELGRLREQLSTEKLRADGLSSDLAFSKKQCAETEAELNSTKVVLEKTESDLEETRADLSGTKAIVDEQSITEHELTNQATVLDKSLMESTEDISGLLAKVQRASCDADAKANASAQLGKDTLVATRVLRQKCVDLHAAIAANGTDIKILLEAASHRNSKMFEAFTEASEGFDKKLGETTDCFFTSSNENLGSIQNKVLSNKSFTKDSMKNVVSTCSNTSDHVERSLSSVLALLQQQHAAIEALSKHVEATAQCAEAKLSEFVQSNAAAILDSQTTHRAEVEQQLAVMASLQQTIFEFSSSQQSKFQQTLAGGTERRHLASQLHKEVRHAEEEAVKERTDIIRREAEERKHALEKDADEMLSTFAAAIEAFKNRHLDACTTSATSTCDMIQQGATSHADKMNAMFAQMTETSETAEQSSFSELSGAVNNFHSSADASITNLKQLQSTSNDKLYTSLDETLSKVNVFSAASTVSANESAVKTSAALDQLNNLGNSMRVECVSSQGNVKQSTDILLTEVSRFETENESSIHAISATVEQMLQGNQNHSCKVTDLRVERSSKLRSSLESGLVQLGSTHQSVLSSNEGLLSIGAGHMAAHDETLTNIESLVSNHVALTVEPLAVTGNTPEKRKFERPEELSHTRAHSLIMKEAKCKRAKQDPLVQDAVSTPSTLKREVSKVEGCENTPSSTRKSKPRSEVKRGSAVKNPLMEATNLVEE